MKKKKYVPNIYIIVIIAIVAIMAIMIKGNFTKTKTGLSKYFFEKSDSEAVNLIRNSNEKYSIDDYNISLEEILYDKGTEIGYCMFKITKNDRKPEIELNSYNQSITGGFGVNGRFTIEDFASQESKFEVIGNTLYQYLSFRADSDFDGEINFVDKDTDKKYQFTLDDMKKSREYEKDEYSVIASPIGISVKTNRDVNKITLHFNDGKEECVYSNTENTGKGLARISQSDNQITTQISFKEIKKIDSIDYVLVDGEKYKKGN